MTSISTLPLAPRETVSFVSPRSFALGNNKGNNEGKQNSLFSVGSVITCFVILPNPKIEKKKIGVKFIC